MAFAKSGVRPPREGPKEVKELKQLQTKGSKGGAEGFKGQEQAGVVVNICVKVAGIYPLSRLAGVFPPS